MPASFSASRQRNEKLAVFRARNANLSFRFSFSFLSPNWKVLKMWSLKLLAVVGFELQPRFDATNPKLRIIERIGRGGGFEPPTPWSRTRFYSFVGATYSVFTDTVDRSYRRGAAPLRPSLARSLRITSIWFSNFKSTVTLEKV